ncbi:hypothetical protein NBM05_13975 [Rothia sp. AR01]|uniref:Uncharacterized protein n=1 Tax=Rothia santali TaxID=2949643 RepID=A0A9X2KJP3_9MICC|nr:hypothetical protein [Rothia santali]MCP3427089.1 hypothetical protein [Rothia santali]
MTYSQPKGFRVPTGARLPAWVPGQMPGAWRAWRQEGVRAVATVLAEVLRTGESRDEVFRRLSYGQVGEEDLLFSRAHSACMITRASEFVDVAHAEMRKPTAVPVHPAIDLRCRAQFVGDPDDPELTWTYVLLGTERPALEQHFMGIEGMEPYPIPEEDAPEDEEAAERAALWRRALAPYRHIAPLSLSAPDPSLLFDASESILARIQDDELASRGKITSSEIVAEAARRLPDRSWDEVDARLRKRLAE